MRDKPTCVFDKFHMGKGVRGKFVVDNGAVECGANSKMTQHLRVEETLEIKSWCKVTVKMADRSWRCTASIWSRSDQCLARRSVWTDFMKRATM